MFGPKFLALSLFVAAALARSVPRIAGIPSHAAHIAHDRENDVLLAFDYDGGLIGSFAPVRGFEDVRRRQGGSCGLLSSTDAPNMGPGWNNITGYAQTNWGGDWDTINANPPQYPDDGAIVCVTGDVAQVTLSGTPACNSQNQTSGGTLVGASGTVTLSANEGTTESTTVTVTQTSMIGSQIQATTTIGIPDLADVTVQLQASVQITNTLATATTVQTSDQTTQSVALSAPANSTCSLTFDVTTCSVTGTGQLGYVASGWIWFFYGSRRSGHYDWAVHIDVLVPDETQRTSYMQFQTQTSSTSNAQYQGVCQ